MTSAKALAKFAMMNCIAAEMREDNDCAIRTLAIVSGKPYTKVHKMLKKAGRKYGQPTYDHVWQAVLIKLGIKIVKVSGYSNKGKYIVTTENHMFAIVDGVKINYRPRLNDVPDIEEIFKV